jgi:hypothetical protein
MWSIVGTFEAQGAIWESELWCDVSALQAGLSAACKVRVAVLVGERAFLGLYRLSYRIISALTFLPVPA